MPDIITIEFESDDFKLVGSLHLPEIENAPVIIGSHGLLANRKSPKQIDLALTSIANGMAYFRFDHRGCGDSQGQFNDVTTLAARIHDLMHAVNTIDSHPAVGPCCGLFGSSFGGAVVLAYAAAHPTPKLLTYAAPLDSQSIRHSNIRDANGQRHPASKLSRKLAFDLAPQLESVRNILIVHSQSDETVPVAHAHQIHDSAKEPKALHIFEGGDHRMSNANHQQLFNRMFIQWFK